MYIYTNIRTQLAKSWTETANDECTIQVQTRYKGINLKWYISQVVQIFSSTSISVLALIETWNSSSITFVKLVCWSLSKWISLPNFPWKYLNWFYVIWIQNLCCLRRKCHVNGWKFVNLIIIWEEPRELGKSLKKNVFCTTYISDSSTHVDSKD